MEGLASNVYLQETAQLEAKAYELEQKTALAAEAKAVLDSWVRYESQVKARQQKELAASVIAKIEKSLSDPKVLDQILKQSVADIERKILQFIVQRPNFSDRYHRHCRSKIG